MPQALKEAGYQTDLIGKWHLGHADRKYWPLERGFDHHYGPLLGEIDYFTHKQHGVLDWFRDGKPIREPGYSTTLLGDAAVRLIESHNPKVPLFLDLAFNAPHAPYQAPEADLDRYRTIADPARRAYAAQVTAMDSEIGRVVKALDANGMRDNTLILFQSDNGGTRNPLFSGEVDTSTLKSLPPDNGPYREGKGTVYEGGTRVISIANWPGRIQPGTVVNEMIHEVDLFPTLIGLAGASTAGTKPLDGLDVWGTISQGKPSPRTEIVYDLQPFRAGLRQGDWKLVWRTPLPQAVELYNLAKDPSEKDNVAAANPEKVADLAAARQRTRRRHGPALDGSDGVQGDEEPHEPARPARRALIDGAAEPRARICLPLCTNKNCCLALPRPALECQRRGARRRKGRHRPRRLAGGRRGQTVARPQEARAAQGGVGRGRRLGFLGKLPRTKTAGSVATIVVFAW